MASNFTLKAKVGEKGILIQEMKPKIKTHRKRNGLNIDGDGDVIIRWFTPIENTTPQKYKEHRYNITKLEAVTFSNKKLPMIRQLRETYIQKVAQGIDPSYKEDLKNITITEAVEIYLAKRFKGTAYSRNLKRYDSIKYISVGDILFGEVWVKNVSLKDYQKVINHREETVKFGTIKRELSIITATLNDEEIEKYSPQKIEIIKLKYKNRDKGKPPLDTRITTPLKIFAQHLYKRIMKETNIEHRLFHLLSFMACRRVGEVQQLKVSDFDIKSKIIISRIETTKQSTTENYPISEEIIDAFLEHTEKYNLKEDDNVFHYLERPYGESFNDLVSRVISDEKIMVTKIFSFTQHDNRTLMGSIMNATYSQDFIGKHLLSHKNKGVDGVYTPPGKEGKEKITQKYWAILRNETETKTKTKIIFEDPRNAIETFYDGGEPKSYFDDNTIEGYFENSSLMYKIELDENKNPISGIWYDENGKEFKCTRATFLKFGLEPK